MHGSHCVERPQRKAFPSLNVDGCRFDSLWDKIMTVDFIFEQRMLCSAHPAASLSLSLSAVSSPRSDLITVVSGGGNEMSFS